MEQIVLRIQEYGHGRGHLHRFSSSSITLGRGYSADCLLEDHYISPLHCRISCCEEGFEVEDLGSANGTHIKDRVPSRKYTISSGTVLRIGRTKITVLAPDHPVAPTRHLETGFFKQGPGRIILAWFLAVLGPFISTLLQVTRSLGEHSMGKIFLEDGVVAFASAVIIAAVWNVIGKVFTHRSHFHDLLKYTSGLFLVTYIMESLKDFIHANVSWVLFQFIIYLIVTSAAIFWMLYHSLAVSSSLKRQTRMLTALIGIIVFTGINVRSEVLDYRRSKYKPYINNSLVRPALRFAPAQDAESFIARWDQLYAAADALAEKQREKEAEKKEKSQASRPKSD
jgi:hypothetical protein